MDKKVQCAKCVKFACYTNQPDDGPPYCPAKKAPEVIEQAIKAGQEATTRAFARMASLQEFECYMHLPEGRTPRNPRVEEVAQFAKKMNYNKLGIAF